MMNNSSIHQMMATTTNPSSSLWNINNNLMRPPLITSSSSSSSSPSNSSSTITNNNFLAPSSYDIISHNNNKNNNNHSLNNNLFQVHQYNNDMNISTITPSSSWLLDGVNNVQEQPPPFHESLSQLLLSGVYMGEEGKKMENWEEQVMLQHHHSFVDYVKRENSVNSYNNNTPDQEFQVAKSSTIWSPRHQINIPSSSPQSCVSTTFSDTSLHHPRHHNHSSECNSTATGGALKKSKIQPSSSPSTFKVRKEKLGDRITALHQLVSPFGKTDTASVLLEAIGYVRFLHNQIEALSLPYLTSGAADKRQPYFVHQGEKNGIFPEDPGQGSYEEAKDLRSRGLCLVPLSCTMNVGSDNGADYWAPALGGDGSFR